MARSGMPDAYIGKEQAYVKHTMDRSLIGKTHVIRAGINSV